MKLYLQDIICAHGEVDSFQTTQLCVHRQKLQTKFDGKLRTAFKVIATDSLLTF